MTRLLLVALALLALPACSSQPPDKVMTTRTDDAVLNAAQDRARASLPAFWARYAHPAANEQGFSVKLGISDGVNTEHFWCGHLQGGAAKASCTIDNDPATVHTVKVGQRIPVDPAIISDWMYLRDGKIVGGETIRVLISYMPEEEAAQYKAMLAEQ